MLALAVPVLEVLGVDDVVGVYSGVTVRLGVVVILDEPEDDLD